MPAQQLETSKSRSAVSSLANNASSQALIRSSYEVGESSYRELGPSLKGSASPVFILPGSQESGLNGEGMGKARGDGSPSKRSPNYVTKTQWTTVAILTFVNLINYMDRYTIAGKLTITYIEKGRRARGGVSFVSKGAVLPCSTVKAFLLLSPSPPLFSIL